MIPLQLKNVLKDLWGRLGYWCAARLERTDAGPSQLIQFPNSHTRGVAIGTFPRGPPDATQSRCVLEV